MRRLRVQILLLNFLLLGLASNSEKTDDSVHYYMTFTNDVSILGGVKYEDIDEDSDEFITVTTKNMEKYICKLPTVAPESNEEVAQYTGPTVDELLKPLYEEKRCSYLIDTYWSYEVCHGKYVIQYHEDKAMNQLKRMEYYLGNYHVDYATEARKKTGEKQKPPTRRIENEDFPYYSVTYTRGTTCDINNKPRKTDVVYICVENAMHKIVSVTEISSCHYEVIIMTEILCKHPAYQRQKKMNYEIMCVNPDAKDPESAKPKSLQKLDDFHDSTFKREYAITHTEPREDEPPIQEEEYDSVQRYSKMDKGKQYQLAGEKRFTNKDTLANNKLVVEHTVNSLLTGKECIVGGQGWWKYEFCYGKQVIQYHQDKNGQRTEIVLGTFDEKIHKSWVGENPKFRGPRKVENHVTQISQIFSKGDICEETGAHRPGMFRSIEVRLRCQHSEYSSLAISLSLTEPKTCQYILTVDSERFCEPLQYADDFGLIHLEPVDDAEEHDDEEDNYGDTPVEDMHIQGEL